MSDCKHCSDHHDSSGFTSGLLLGVVLGAAGVHFLTSSEEGKEILTRLKENASDTLKDLGENPALANKIADLQKTMDQARATINTAAEKIVVATETPKHHPKKNFFQKLGASLGK
ncbi:MAG: YtxH domain-containing protein [Microgenomates group bacterium]